MIRYFKHKTGFDTGGVYIEVNDSKTLYHKKDCVADITPDYPLFSCLKVVQDGHWIELNKAEAFQLKMDIITNQVEIK